MTTNVKLSQIFKWIRLFYFGYCNHIYVNPNDPQHKCGWHNQELRAMLSSKERSRLANIKACIRNCREDNAGVSNDWIEQTYEFLEDLVKRYQPEAHQTLKSHSEMCPKKNNK